MLSAAKHLSVSFVGMVARCFAALSMTRTNALHHCKYFQGKLYFF